MCGIAAALEFHPDDNTPGRLRSGIGKALDRMKERGPDGRGVLVGDTWAVGHLRLSIMDLAAGAQPWSDEGCHLVYNGEIFNYRTLNAELAAKGRTIKTHCDTETVLAAYLEWGEQCIERFNGFFAFALVDTRKNTLFIARDRLGVKPLHYLKDGSRLWLASSAAGVMEGAGGHFQPDIEALSHFLTTGRVVFGQRTMIKDVMALPPAHCMAVDLKNGDANIRRYWSRPCLSKEEKEQNAPPFEQAVESVGKLLDDAVAIRLMSDVPLGSFLSGGIDSSIIALCASKRQRELPLFCAVSGDRDMDENTYAELMAAKLGMPLEEVKLDAGGFLKDWGWLCERKGLPLSTPNEVSIHRLSLALGRKCKVALTGEGADEIFGGYGIPQFSAYDLERSMAGKPDVFENSSLGIAMSLAFGRCRFLNDTDHFLSTAAWMPYLEKADLFKREVWEAIEEDSAVFEFYENFFDRYGKCSLFDRRMHLFAEFNLESLLHRIDNSSMCASIEARVPFTDYRLTELAFSLPDSYKIALRPSERANEAKEMPVFEIEKQGMLETKRLPRTAFRDELPKEIVERPKKSFPVPVSKWLRGELMDEVRKICLDSPLAGNVFDKSVLERRLGRPGEELWALANACRWAADLP